MARTHHHRSEAPGTGTSWLTPRSVTWYGVAVDVVLSVGKIGGGVLFSSQAILADGLHSTSDLMTDFAVLAGLKVSDKPADGEHHYGHRRVATLVAMFIGAVLLLAGGGIGYRAIVSLQRPAPLVGAGGAFWIAAAAIPIKEILYRITRYVGRRESDISFLANAWHHRSDAVTSVAAAAGLGGVLLGGPKWIMLDALTALVLAAFLAVVAFRIIISSASELIDQAPSSETLSGIKQAVAATEGVRSFHAIRARRIGGKVEMDVHVQVAPQLTVREGHDIAVAVRHAVRQADAKVVEVIVHVEPAGQSRLE